MKTASRIMLLVLVLVLAFNMSGCYWMKQVEASERGVILDDGVTVNGVSGPGRFTKLSWYAELIPIHTGIMTATWSDPSLVTKDNQPIGLELAVSYRRKADSNSITDMFINYPSESRNDEALKALVFSRIPDVAKGVTAGLTLDEMLRERNVLSAGIDDNLAVEMNEVYVELVTVQVTNIAIDPGYEDKLKQKAAVIVERQIAQESVKTAEENLKKTVAETEIQLELARRQNLVNEELAKVYQGNPQFFELKRLEALEKVIGKSDKIIFVPEGSSLSVIQTTESKVVPVPSE